MFFSIRTRIKNVISYLHIIAMFSCQYIWEDSSARQSTENRAAIECSPAKIVSWLILSLWAVYIAGTSTDNPENVSSNLTPPVTEI
jgi:hypothetical protein